MLQLIYISTARQQLGKTQLEEILRISRRNNARVGLTGLLVVGGRRFLQVLEGEPNAVDKTFERIAADPRHFATVVLWRQQITVRAFPEWSMGFQPWSVGGIIGSETSGLIQNIADPTIRAQFEQFALQHAF